MGFVNKLVENAVSQRGIADSGSEGHTNSSTS